MDVTVAVEVEDFDVLDNFQDDVILDLDKGVKEVELEHVLVLANSDVVFYFNHF